MPRPPLSYYLDFAWSQPSPLAIKSNGYSGICVYLGSARPDSAYFTAARAAGLGILLIQEWGTTDAYGGYPVGVAQARAANDIADAIGAPADCAIAYVAADTPNTGPEYAGALADWARGIRDVGRRGFKIGYGNEASLMMARPDTLWGVETWANERNGKEGWYEHGNLAMIQMANTRVHSVPGYDTDENEVYMSNFGQWGAAPAPEVPSVKRYSEGVKMLKFTDHKGTSVEMFVQGSALYARYWRSGKLTEAAMLSDQVQVGSDLLPVEGFGVTLVHAIAQPSLPGKVIEAYPTDYGYQARVV